MILGASPVDSKMKRNTFTLRKKQIYDHAEQNNNNSPQFYSNSPLQRAQSQESNLSINFFSNKTNPTSPQLPSHQSTPRNSPNIKTVFSHSPSLSSSPNSSSLSPIYNSSSPVNKNSNRKWHTVTLRGASPRVKTGTFKGLYNFDLKPNSQKNSKNVSFFEHQLIYEQNFEFFFKTIHCLCSSLSRKREESKNEKSDYNFNLIFSFFNIFLHSNSFLSLSQFCVSKELQAEKDPSLLFTKFSVSSFFFNFCFLKQKNSKKKDFSFFLIPLFSKLKNLCIFHFSNSDLIPNKLLPHCVNDLITFVDQFWSLLISKVDSSFDPHFRILFDFVYLETKKVNFFFF